MSILQQKSLKTISSKIFCNKDLKWIENPKLSTWIHAKQAKSVTVFPWTAINTVKFGINTRHFSKIGFQLCWIKIGS